MDPHRRAADARRVEMKRRATSTRPHESDAGEVVVAQQRVRRRVDAGMVFVATIGSFLIASRLELHEYIASRLIPFEAWQADELPLALTVLMCGLAWYAARRRRDAMTALAARIHAEERAHDLLEQNRELSRQLISLQETERQALARDLHDDLAQTCTAIRVETAYLRKCDGRDRSSMLAAADRVDAAAADLTRLIRNLLRRLRPIDLETLGLESSLQSLCESWSKRTGTRCELAFAGPADRGMDFDVAIYRIVQEALTNAARHANATNVEVSLKSHSAHEVELVIVDDGRGMDLQQVHPGLGLLIARERIAAMGGDLRLVSRPAEGLRIEIRIPCETGAADRTDPTPVLADEAVTA